jgi:hypothetical protein
MRGGAALEAGEQYILAKTWIQVSNSRLVQNNLL